MPIYQIKISYQTGDSFGSEDQETILEYEWEDLEIARENLKRIEEHYKWYSDYDNERKDKWKKSIPPFCVSHSKYESPKYDYSILLLADKGKGEYQLYPMWCGDFERLYDAEIVFKGNSPDKISFRW